MARRTTKNAVSERREVKERIQNYSIDLDYTDFDHIIEQLQAIRNDPANAKYHRFTIEMDRMDYSDSEKEYPYPYGTRWETDKEFAARQEKEEASEAARLEQDRATFERLRKQFGDK